jgi:hypothetical protein
MPQSSATENRRRHSNALLLIRISYRPAAGRNSIAGIVANAILEFIQVLRLMEDFHQHQVEGAASEVLGLAPQIRLGRSAIVAIRATTGPRS